MQVPVKSRKTRVSLNRHGAAPILHTRPPDHGSREREQRNERRSYAVDSAPPPSKQQVVVKIRKPAQSVIDGGRRLLFAAQRLASFCRDEPLLQPARLEIFTENDCAAGYADDAYVDGDRETGPKVDLKNGFAKPNGLRAME